MRPFARLPIRLAPLLTTVMLISPAAAAPAVLNGQAIARAGIAVATLHAARRARLIPALGQVLDPAPLIRLQGEIATADATIAGAKAKVVLEQQQMAQASVLYKHGQVISLADYQKAAEDLAANRAVLAVERTKRAALLAQTAARWGTAMAGMLSKNSPLLPQLAAGTAILVGVSLPPGVTLAAPPRQAEGEAAGRRFALTLIGPVSGMLGGYPGQSFLYEAMAQPGAPVGTTVSVSLLAGPQRAGVVVPRSAVLWRGNHALVFRADAGNRFEPVPIATDVPAKGGYFVTAGLSPGESIVVRGAGLLLGAVGQKPHPAGEDAD